MRRPTESRPRPRRGGILVEFALIALVSYLLLAATLEFGRAIFCAQVLQQAADVLAREIARTPISIEKDTLAKALQDVTVRATIFDPKYLAVPLGDVPSNQTFAEYFADPDAPKPIVNQLLLPLMYVDRENNLLRYPGQLTTASDGSTTVAIPFVTYGADGSETIVETVGVVESVGKQDSGQDLFGIDSSSTLGGGLVAVRLNYPFQAASLSAYAPAPLSGPPNVVPVRAVSDAGSDADFGPYAGDDSLGRQAAWNNDPSNHGRAVRPFRRLISAQAIYRREVIGSSASTGTSPNP